MTKYYGWIFKRPEEGYADHWGLRLTHDSSGKEVEPPKAWFNFATAGEAIEMAEKYLDRRIRLEPTINAEMGYRIYL